MKPTKRKPSPRKMSNLAFVAIRENESEGITWMDTSTIALSPEWAKDKAHDTDRETGPNWAYFNPVVRIIEIKIEEI